MASSSTPPQTAKVSFIYRCKKRIRYLKTEYPLYLFLIPAILCTVIFLYFPMFTNVIAFMDYDPTNGWMGLSSPFSGLANFKTILSDPSFYVLVGRTIFYSLIVLAVTFPARIIFALLLNELRSIKLKRTVQTISYLPHFISWVILASLIYLFLSQDTSGVFNNIRELFGLPRITFMKYVGNFPIVMALGSLYKEVGWGSIIYLSAISAVDTELYEAAKMDGASRFKQVWHITLPSIMPTIAVMLVLSMGGILSSNFDQVYNLQNPVIQNNTNTIATYVYIHGIMGHKYSIAAAVGLFQGVVNCLLLVGTDRISKKLTSHGLF